MRQVLVVLVLITLSIPAYGGTQALRVPDQKAIPMLVGIDPGKRWTATGTVIARGLVLTVRHAVARKMHIYLPSAVVEGQVLCEERNADLALVRSENLPEGPTYAVSLSPPKEGEHVVVGGYPSSLWTVTEAEVLEIAASARIGGVLYSSTVVRFRPQHTMGKGASGSPLISSKGYVVGVLAGVSGNEDAAFALGSGLQDCRGFIPQSSQRP